MFNNVAIAAKHAQQQHRLRRFVSVRLQGKAQARREAGTEVPLPILGLAPGQEWEAQTLITAELSVPGSSSLTGMSIMVRASSISSRMTPGKRGAPCHPTFQAEPGLRGETQLCAQRLRAGVRVLPGALRLRGPDP